MGMGMAAAMAVTAKPVPPARAADSPEANGVDEKSPLVETATSAKKSPVPRRAATARSGADSGAVTPPKAATRSARVLPETPARAAALPEANGVDEKSPFAETATSTKKSPVPR